MSAEARRWRAARRGPLVVVASLVVAVVLAEVTLRLAGLRFDGAFFQGDRDLGWVLIPGLAGWNVSEGEAYTRVNRLGQMDAERVVEKARGSYRIAVLGDSMVEARQVPLEQRFTQLMERTIGACAARPVEVLNFGVGGYSSAQELIQLRTRVWEYQPDFILFGVYLGNDLFDNLKALDPIAPARRPFFVRRGSELVLDEAYKADPSVSPRRIWMRAWGSTLLNGSRLLMLVNQARLGLRRSPPAAAEAAGHAIPDHAWRLWAYQVPTHPAHIDAWVMTEAILREAGADARQRSTAFGLLYLPMTAETDADADRRSAFRQELAGSGDVEYPRRRLKAFADREAIRFLDPTDEMLTYAVNTRTLVNGFPNTPPNVGHLNQHGHRVLAEFLSRSVCGSEFAEKRPLE